MIARNVVSLAITHHAAPLCAAFLFAAMSSSTALAQTSSTPLTPKPIAVPGISAPLPAPVTSAPAVPATPFSAIGDKPAIVFDAPSAKAQKVFVFSRNMPVEVLTKTDKWVKVRDSENTLGWVEASALSTSRFVQVNVEFAQIRETASDSASLVFEAQRAVLLEVIGSTTQGFVPVRHRDGPAGFVLKSQVWGN